MRSRRLPAKVCPALSSAPRSAHALDLVCYFMVTSPVKAKNSGYGNSLDTDSAFTQAGGTLGLLAHWHFCNENCGE